MNLNHPAKALSALALTALLAVAVTACGSAVTTQSNPTPASGGTQFSITNCGRGLSFNAAPQRTVGLSPSQTDLLARLGLATTLVGQAQTSTHALPQDVAPLVESVPKLSDVAPPTREVLLGVKPDFVVSPTEYEFTAESGFASLEQLKQAGAQAYVATAGCAERRRTGSVEDLLTDIKNLGGIYAVPDQAAELVKQAEQRLEKVQQKLQGVNKLKVAQLFVEGNTLSAIGAGIEYDIVARGGGTNVFQPTDPAFSKFFAASISAEQVASKNPDAIVFAVNGPEQEQNARSYFKRTFPDLEAVTKGRLIAISAADVFPGAWGNIAAVEKIAQGLYPDRH